MSDLIDRQAAIDEIKALYEWHDTVTEDRTIDHLKRLPTAQPETHEERTETHACDLISRQAAIDAILAVTGNSSVRELYEHVQEHGLSEMWSGGVNAAIDIIIALPSAEPEQRYTEEELRVFKHGISLSLLSKESSQHWQYDEDTATEIKFLERLYEKVVADMRGKQDGRDD